MGEDVEQFDSISRFFLFFLHVFELCLLFE